MKKRDIYIGLGFLAVLAALGAGSLMLEEKSVVQAAGVMAPRFEVDPMWPKPMPNHWLIGNTIGVDVDAKENVWIIHRAGSLERGELHLTAGISQCCAAAPPILVFDQAGNLIKNWGGPGQGYNWPDSNHGVTIDFKGNVWIGGNGRGPQSARGTVGGEDETLDTGKKKGSVRVDPFADNMVLKFTQEGKFLMQIGKPKQSKGSNDTEHLRLPAKTFVDAQTNELYVADGYGNHRVIVYDAETGKYKRHWGAYGKVPSDDPMPAYNPTAPPDQQFRNPVHCVVMSVDRLLYVCDRQGDRVQVFKPDGTFVKEMYYAKETLGSGSAWDLVLSKDAQQKYMYLADGENDRVHIIERQSMELLTTFGEGGRQPGMFYGVHSLAVDSKGNLYTTETYRGQRLQKFVYKGLAPVTAKDQGTLWPKK